jgi:UDP-N-acetylmuramate--alanine ligase
MMTEPALRLGGTTAVHFVGVGGIGMSGLAELLANLGYRVSGSDLRAPDETIGRLVSRFGVTVHRGHAARHVGEADVVVYSAAVMPDNPELLEAARRGIPVIPRAELLGELMRLRTSIAVSGSHGKTTTTSMTAFVLEQAGLDPTAVIGGRLNAFGSNARLGRGEFLVAEADESDRSFLLLWPTIAIVTNLDDEHLDRYAGMEALREAFTQFANRVPFYGRVIACADDPHVRAILPRLTRRVLTYGLSSEDADVVGADVDLGTFGGRCAVHARTAGGLQPLGTLELAVPGRHNLLNALAAIAAAGRVGVPFERAAEALSRFAGAERRFDRRGEAGGVLVVDDYGHHPTEIAAVLAAARTALPGRRRVVAFQPHRYSRTARLLEAFGPSLREADLVVLTDIYAAGEAPIPGITAGALGDAIGRATGRPVQVASTLDEALETLVGLAQPGDVIITLGAGSIGALADRLLEALRRRETGG